MSRAARFAAEDTDTPRSERTALAGVAQWIQRGPMNQRVAGSIPSQGRCLGHEPGPQ